MLLTMDVGSDIVNAQKNSTEWALRNPWCHGDRKSKYYQPLFAVCGCWGMIQANQVQ